MFVHGSTRVGEVHVIFDLGLQEGIDHPIQGCAQWEPSNPNLSQGTVVLSTVVVSQVHSLLLSLEMIIK